MEPKSFCIRQLLNDKYGELKKNNPRYSQRSFAKKLNLASGVLSELMSGKRRVGKKLAKQIAEKLMLDPVNTASILHKFEIPPKKNVVNLNADYIILSAQDYDKISDWHHMALISLMRTKSFKSDTQWIARKLNLTESQVIHSLQVLTELKLVFKNSHKQFECIPQYIHTTDNIPSETIRKSHLTDLDLAKKSLHSIPVNKRDFTSMTISVDPKKIEDAKKLIRDFREKLSQLISHPEATEIYKLNINLFPLSNDEV